jgi:hypothetical protein
MNIFAGFCFWRMAERCVVGGFERCRGARRAARHDAPRQDLGSDSRATSRGYAHGGRGTRREDGAVSVDGCGSCGEGVQKWESAGRACANLVNSSRVFDLVKICTDFMLGLRTNSGKGASSFAKRVRGGAGPEGRREPPFVLGEMASAAYARTRERIACSS